LGNVWFVNELKWVNNPDEEYAAIANFEPDKSAIVDKKWEKALAGSENIKFSSNDSIKLISYKPNYLEYRSKSQNPELAVFSEIFYDKGWNAYIDGKLVPHGRADYVLRTMVVPSGDHNIDFKFEPVSYKIGQHIAFISSLIVGLLLLFVFVKLILDYSKKQEV